MSAEELKRDTGIIVPELPHSVIEALEGAVLPPLLRTEPAPCGLVEVASVTMGGGKTQAVEVLAANLGALAVAQVEMWEKNPFLEDLERRFQSEVWFLRAKADQNLGISNFSPETLVFQDQPLEGDHLFAPVDHSLGTLSGEELRLYQEFYQAWAPRFFMPDLIVYLDCPMPEIFRRIKERGREFEQAQRERIRALAHLTNRWIGNGAWGEIPTLVVDSERLNFATDPKGKQELTRMVVEKLKEVNGEKFAYLEVPTSG